MHGHVCLSFFGGTQFWHMRKPGFSPVKMTQVFQDPSICFNFLYLHWKVNRYVPLLRLRRLSWMLYNYFCGIFSLYKPVSCWILFCENVTGIPRPLDQLPSHVGKVNTFKTPEMCLYFNPDVSGRCLTIIFARSFPYFKFLSAKLTVKWDTSSRPKIGQ